MRKLAVFLLVLAVLLGAVEFAATRLTENEIEKRLAREVSADVQAEVDSFPPVTRLLVTEEVNRVEVTFTEVDLDEIDFDTLTIEVEGVRLPRARLIDRDLRPTAIASGTVSALISTDAIAQAVGVSLPPIDPETTAARLEDGALTLEVSGAPPVTVQVPREALPCSGEGEVAADGIRLRCSVQKIPDILLENLPR